MKLDKSLLNENLFKKTSSAKKSSIFAQQMKMKGLSNFQILNFINIFFFIMILF